MSSKGTLEERIDNRIRQRLSDRGGVLEKLTILTERLNTLDMPTWVQTKKSFETYLEERMDAFNAVIDQNKIDLREFRENCYLIKSDVIKTSEEMNNSYDKLVLFQDAAIDEYTKRCDSLQASLYDVERLKASLGKLASPDCQDAVLGDLLTCTMRLSKMETWIQGHEKAVSTRLSTMEAWIKGHEKRVDVDSDTKAWKDDNLACKKRLDKIEAWIEGQNKHLTEINGSLQRVDSEIQACKVDCNRVTKLDSDVIKLDSEVTTMAINIASETLEVGKVEKACLTEGPVSYGLLLAQEAAEIRRGRSRTRRTRSCEPSDLPAQQHIQGKRMLSADALPFYPAGQQPLQPTLTPQPMQPTLIPLLSAGPDTGYQVPLIPAGLYSATRMQ